MTNTVTLPVDNLAELLDADKQRQAARMAQDTFAEAFRIMAAPTAADAASSLTRLEQQSTQWCHAGGGDEGQTARLALLVSGLDQWGLAYAQAFKLTALPALTHLLGALRGQLDVQADARFQQAFSRLSEDEGYGIDFKITLRRGIHLALWHALAASDSEAQSEALIQALGSLLLALDQQMPTLGWRLIADTLSHIQIALLSGETSTLAQTSTQQLFASLRHALPRERYETLLATSGQAVLAWQHARRASAH